jgi:hypothetical protein
LRLRGGLFRLRGGLVRVVSLRIIIIPASSTTPASPSAPSDPSPSASTSSSASASASSPSRSRRSRWGDSPTLCGSAGNRLLSRRAGAASLLGGGRLK